MVDLPKVNDTGATSSAPQSAITAGAIEKSANARAGAFGDVADALMQTSVDLAKKQAADDLIKQKVTRNADGSVTVQDPASAPLIFGEAGKAYNDAVKVGTIAEHSNDISEHFAELHTQFPTDPAGFKAASQAYLDKRGQQITGPMGEAIQRQGAQLQTQHYNSITSTTATNDLENKKVSIKSQIDDQKNTAIALARQGGADTPEFKQAVEKMNLSYDALATNPLFKMPQDQIDLEKKNTAGLLQGEALVSHIDSTFNKRGKGDAQKALDVGILQNQNLREVDRSRLYTQGLSRLAYLTANAKETIDANRQITTEMETGLSKGTVKAEDPAVGLAIKRARDIGDTEGAQRITAASAVQQQLRGVGALPTAIKAEVLGVPGPNGNGPVNTDIPPEGRALLKTIGSSESANRYDIRYGGQRFMDYADHPRVAEPITSGPDVGKTSSAAGYYQMIGSTWDGQKQKLGLTDFSPKNQDLAAWDLAQTEYKKKTGQDLLPVLKSGDQNAINNVLPALSGQWSSLPGGRQPAGRFMAPSASGGPGFTPDDVQKNPFLLSAYVRTLAADPELRVQSAKQTAEAVGKALDNGILPSPAAIAEVNQAAQLYPEKMGSVADAMNGRLKGQQIAQLPQPQRDAIEEQYKRATDGQDVHHINVAAAALKQVQDSEKNMKDHPYDEAAQRGWTQPAAQIDPAKPETIAPALAQRAALSSRIGSLNQSPNPPLLDKDEMPQLQAALQGPNGAAVLGQIAQTLKPEEMKTLFDQKEFTDSVTGMMSSKDPNRMRVAMSVVDAKWRSNAAEASATFGDAAITKLQAWQALNDSFAPQELAERLNASDDPSTVKARAEAKEAAEKETASLSPGDMAYKLGTSWGIPIVSRVANLVTGSTPAVPFDSIKGGELVADYRATYTALRAYGVDADKASDLAVKRLGATWGSSQAAGNQIMRNPPEKFYPAIDGKQDWIQQDLNSWVSGKVGDQFGAPPISASPASAPGLIEAGNIDLTKRPQVKTPDGKTATVRSLGVNFDGKETLIPTVSDDGRIMTNDEAVAEFKKTGKHLGVFDTEKNSNDYAQSLHLAQEKYYSRPKGSIARGDIGFDRPSRNWDVQGLISDGQTQAEIAAGKPPSYQVAIKKGDGALSIIPSRIAFDPSDHIAEHGARLEQRKQGADFLRAIQFQAGGAQP